MTKKYDVLVVGGGPGGTPAAMALAAAQRHVLLVERGAGLGGTCLFEGCIPSKILYESAQRLRAIRRAAEFGLCLSPGEPHIDWQAIVARKDAVLRQRAQWALDRAQTIPALDVRFGAVALLNPRRALLKPTSGEPYEVEFASAIIATGSKSVRPAVLGSGLARMITSEQVFDLEYLPRSLVVVGAGPVGVELSQIFAAFGVRVTLLEAGLSILGQVDEEIARMLEVRMLHQGVSLVLDARVTRICHAGGGAFVQYRDTAGAAHEAYGEYVLEVTGREACTEELGLENTAVRYDRHGIRVNHVLETDEPGLYAVGDVVGQPMFAHWASAQSLVLAHYLLGQPVRFPEPAVNAAVIFSIPEIGMAGLTEGEARKAGHEIEVVRYDFSVDARAQVAGHADGLLKVVYERGTHRVLGVHALGEGIASIMGEAALAVGAGITMEALALIIHPHPTLSESFALAAHLVPTSVFIP